MLKKLLVSGLLGVSMFAGLEGEGNGHLKGTVNIGGSWVHVSSFTASMDIGGVPNPATKPSLFEAKAIVKRVEILCRNPQNNNVIPGEAGTQIVLVVQDTINPSDITDKKKGIAHKEVLFPDELFLDPAFCVNPNWIPVDAIVTELTGAINIFECTGSGADPCSTKVLTYRESKECVLPPEFGIENPPPPGTTPYACVFTLQEHVK